MMIIDDHTISRACRALLRTGGVDVVADGGALEAVEVLGPDVVVIDDSAHDERGIEVARQIAAMAHAARVVLTSSADAERFASRLHGHGFLAKADVCVDALTRVGPRSY